MSKLEKIQAMLAESPDDLFLRYSLAMELRKTGDVDRAREAFAKVREIDPDYVPAYFQEGQLLAEAEQRDAAEKILQQGINVAQRVGDDHALEEMREFLEML